MFGSRGQFAADVFNETYGFAVLSVPNFLGTPRCLGKLQAMILFDLINGANDIEIDSINVQKYPSLLTLNRCLVIYDKQTVT